MKFYWIVIHAEYGYQLIIPYRIHTESLLTNLQPRNASQKLVVPSVYLDAALFVVGQREPLVRPGARRHGVGVAARRGRGVQTDLALNGARGTDFKRCNVARE